MGVDHPGLPMSMAGLIRLIRRVAKATLQNSSIGRAGIRVYNAGEIVFEGGGGVRILGDGYINIDGDLTGAGDLSWTGPWNLSGLGTVTGDADWSGDINLTGIIEVGGPTGVTINGATGEITVNGAFPVRLRQVGGGAVIEVGGTTISVQDGLLKIDAGSGTGVFQDGFGIQLKSGGVAFAAGSFGPQIIGLPTITTTTSGLPAGVVHANPSGQLYRVVEP